MGTEMLSSRRTGIVSMNAAATAAATGASQANTAGGNGVTAARVHSASATPARLPQTRRRRACDGLFAIPRQRRRSESTTGKGRRPVTECQDAPRRGGDVRPRRKGEDQHENRRRVDQDPEWKPSSMIGRPIEPAAAHQRKDGGVERDGDAGQSRRLPPRQVAKQQGKAARSHVDELTGCFRVRRRHAVERDASVRRMPSSSGVIV